MVASCVRQSNESPLPARVLSHEVYGLLVGPADRAVEFRLSWDPILACAIHLQGGAASRSGWWRHHLFRNLDCEGNHLLHLSDDDDEARSQGTVKPVHFAARDFSTVIVCVALGDLVADDCSTVITQRTDTFLPLALAIFRRSDVPHDPTTNDAKAIAKLQATAAAPPAAAAAARRANSQYRREHNPSP